MEDKPEETLLSGVEIQEAPLVENNEEDNQNATPKNDEGPTLSLGDRIHIESSKYKSTLGRIYYIDDSLIRVLPDGVSDRLYDFPILDGEFNPELDVTNVEFEEGPRTSFVSLTGLRANSKIDTFGANGEPIVIFTIKEVNESSDSAIISDSTDAEIILNFNYKGIPLDNLFAVLRISPEAAVENYDEPEPEVPENTLEDDEEIVDIGTLKIPVAQSFIEITAKDQTFPDASQKSDLIGDLLSYFSEASRKNPVLKKRIRTLTEQFYQLKSDIIKSRDDGSIFGEEKLSFETLAELLENRTVPLAKPVLTTKRVLQIDEIIDSGGSEKHTDTLDIYLLKNTIEGYAKFIESYGNLQAGQEMPSESALPIFYQWLNGYIQRFPLGDVYEGDSYTFASDNEYLRQDIEEIDGFPKLNYKTKDEILTDSDIGTIQMSLRRGLGQTVRKQGEGGQRTVMRADRADAKFFLLFPEKTASILGSKRTGSLFIDIMRSHEEKLSLKRIFDITGEPTEEPDANNILILKSGGLTIANISWAEYLDVVLTSMTPRGTGDIRTFLNDYGVINKEFTVEQQEVVNKRTKEVIILLRGLVRGIIADVNTVEPTYELVQGEAFKEYIVNTVGEHPYLKSILDNAKQRSPGYSKTDIGIISVLYKYSQDYALAVLANEPIGIQRERLRASRNTFIQSLINAQKVRMNLLEGGEEPEVNSCPHVKGLNQIRRVKDDNERMGLLSIFIRTYQGGREDNWVTCSFCKQNLICQHELLQVQQYLHAREFDALQKQIILNFTGGTFGAKHVCKNCGIPISDIDYDRNVEFDDEGRPLNGRGAVIDTDAVEEEELSLKLGAPIGTQKEIDFETEDKNVIYQTTRQLCDRLGIFPDAEGYRRIVNRVNIELLRQDRKSYMETQKRKKEKGERTSDYDIYINRLLVSFTAACLLLELQSKIPDYSMRYAVPGCKAGFDGYPLYPTADPKSVTESTGIHYIACAITGIVSDKAPWVLTGWQQERSDAKRQLNISSAIINVLRSIALEPTTQIALEKKRDYLKEIFGKESDTGRPSEKLPFRFQPPIETNAEAILESAARPVVPESAAADSSAIVINWIRAANEIAKKNVRLVPNTPYTETGSCFTNINEPGKFWVDKKEELPPLPRKIPLAFVLGKQSWLFVPFEARPLEVVEVETPIYLAYKIFARICWRGEREGRPHELGFDGKCDWCDTQIPIEVLYPDVDKAGKPVVGDDKLQASFTEQGIPITKESFEKLLQVSHMVNKFKSYRPPLPIESGIILQRIGDIGPQPIDNWKESISNTIVRLAAVKVGAERAEIADALQDIAESVSNAEMIVANRIGQDAFGVLSSIFSESATNVFETIKSYLVLPIQRIITSYNTDQMKVHKQYMLSQDHQEDIVSLLKQHTRISSSINRDTLGEFGLIKYRYYIEQMSAILKQASEIKTSRIAYGVYVLPYILRTLVMGPLSSLLDPNQIPSDAADLAGLSAGKSAKSILLTIRALVQLYTKERLSYSSELIKDKIAKADEKERDGVINDIDKLSDDDKKLELIRKNLGLGRWAIGGTKLIYSYDADQYDKERELRMSQYQEGENPTKQEGRQADKYGVFTFGEDYNQKDAGYDMVFYDIADAE